MGDFTEGCGDNGMQDFIFLPTTKQFGVESDRCASTRGETEHSIQETSLNRQLQAEVFQAEMRVEDRDVSTTPGVIMLSLTTTPL